MQRNYLGNAGAGAGSVDSDFKRIAQREGDRTHLRPWRAGLAKRLYPLLAQMD